MSVGATPLVGWRKPFAWLIFPVVTAGSVAATAWAISAGYDTRFTPLFGIAPGALCVILSEIIQPHSPEWTRSHGDVKTDLFHVVFSQLAPPPLIDLGMKASLGVLAVTLAQDGGPWPHSLPMFAQVVLVLLMAEFGQYWWHRLCHESAFFWRFHSVHHSAPRLYWLNAARFHPLDTIIQYTLSAAPAVVMGAPAEVIAYFAVFTAIHGLFQHSNIELRLGPLNWVFSMAELHRWHHSIDLRDANANYGANIIFWDIVFGTRHLPADREHQPDDVGFAGVESFPTGYLGQLWVPFKREVPGAIDDPAHEALREARDAALTEGDAEGDAT